MIGFNHNPFKRNIVKPKTTSTLLLIDSGRVFSCYNEENFKGEIMLPLIPILTNVGISLAANLVVKGLRKVAKHTDNELDDALVCSFSDSVDEVLEKAKKK